MNKILDKVSDQLTRLLDWIGTWYNEKWSWGLLLGAILFEVVWYLLYPQKP